MIFSFKLYYILLSFIDEWENLLERIGRGDTGDAELQESSSDSLELRFWASYRGQTLARTGQIYLMLSFFFFFFMYLVLVMYKLSTCALFYVLW